MARQDATRIAPRTVVDSSQSANVGLQTNNWMGLSQQANGALFALAGKISDVVAGGVQQTLRTNAGIDKMRGAFDTKQGETERMRQDETGQGDASVLNDPAKSAEYKRGYKAVDGTLKARAFTLQANKDMQSLDPDTTNIHEWVQKQTAAFIESNKGQDPDVQAAMLPALERSKTSLLNAWNEQDIKETAARQQDAAFGVAVDGIKSGELLTPDGLQKFYALMGGPEFGSMHRSEKAEVVAKAAAEVLQSGNVDPEKAMAFFSQSMPDGTPGIGKTEKYRESLMLAASRGANVIKQRKAEHDKAVESAVAYQMDDMAKVGMLGDHRIDDFAERTGHAHDAKWKLAWRRKNMASIQARQEATVTASTDNTILGYVLTHDARANYYPQAKVQAVTDKALQDAMTHLSPDAVKALNEDPDGGLKAAADAGDRSAQQALFLTGALSAAGGKSTALSNRFDQFDPKDMKTSVPLLQDYVTLNSHSPALAHRNVDPKVAAHLDQAVYLMREFKLSPQEAINKLATAQPPAPELIGPSLAKSAVKFADKLPESVNKGFVQNRVFTVAKQMMATGVMDADTAYQAAIKHVKANSVTVGGRMIPDLGLPPSAGKAADDYLAVVKNELVKAKRLDPTSDITALPLPGDPGKFVVVDGITLIPVTDPETGERKMFDPRKMAALHGTWQTNNLVAETKAKQSITADEAKYGGRAPPTLPPSEQAHKDGSWDSMTEAEKEQTTARENDFRAGVKKWADSHGYTGDMDKLERKLWTAKQRYTPGSENEARQASIASQARTYGHTSFGDFLKNANGLYVDPTPAPPTKEQAPFSLDEFTHLLDKPHKGKKVRVTTNRP